MPQAQVLDTGLHNLVDAHGVEVPAERLAIAPDVHGAKEGAIPILGMPSCLQIRPEALRCLRMNRHDRVCATFPGYPQSITATRGVEIADLEADDRGAA
jgi:hypothetical protein